MKPAEKTSPKLLPVDLYDLTVEDKKRFREEEALGMVVPQSALLNKPAKAVAPGRIKSNRIQALVERLLEVAGRQQGRPRTKERRMLVGLAAPQIGEPWRVVVVDTKIGSDRKSPTTLECFINPKIVWRSRQTEEGREGCFSAGPVWGLVRRAVAIKVRYLTPEGEAVERPFEGFAARIVQHECDHLEGLRFPDRIKSDRKRHWVHAEEIPLYPKHIDHWPRQCGLERWQAFKRATIK